MSLRTFHLIFIVCSILLSLALGTWGIRGYLRLHDGESLGLGILGFVLAGALVGYERWFSGRHGPLARGQ